jgi:DNA-directed RNA polymerase subunit RPC12/RpoP
MLLIFRCNRCGREFQVEDRYQGRKGRCKDCGQVMMIPRPAFQVIAPASGGEKPAPTVPAVPPAEESLFRLSPPEQSPRMYPRQPPPEIGAAQEDAGEGSPIELAAPRSPRPRPTEELPYEFELIDDDEEVSAALPVSPEIERGLRELAEFAKDPRDYSLEVARGGRTIFSFGRRGDSGPASWLVVKWRRAITRILKLLRWIDAWAYLISVPFLILLALGIIIDNTPLAHLGAVVIVLVNYGRFWTDLLALFVRPFKQSPLHGLAFLFPPYGLYFVATRWRQVKPTLRRLATSCIPIALVVFAYAFLPSVNPGVENVEGVGAKLEAGEKQLVKDIDEGIKEFEERLPSLEFKPKDKPEQKP